MQLQSVANSLFGHVYEKNVNDEAGQNKGEKNASFADLLVNKVSNRGYEIDIDPSGNIMVSGDVQSVKTIKKLMGEDEKNESYYTQLKSMNNDWKNSCDAKRMIDAYVQSPTRANLEKARDVLA